MSTNAMEKFVLTDADGEEHHYEVKAHDAVEGQRLLFALLAVGVEPVAQGVLLVMQNMADELMESAGDILKEGLAETVAGLDITVENVLAGVDVGGLGESLKKSFASGKCPALVRALLTNTFRDGHHLEKDLFFNAAYTANYWEMLQAVWKVLGINRFLPPLSGLQAAKSLPKTAGSDA